MSSAPRRVDPTRLPQLRSGAQLLHRPRGSPHPADIARLIAGAQAQDANAGRLAFRARSARITAAAVDTARNEERSLVRTWVMRKTMHLVAADDVPWLAPLFEPIILAASRRRLAQLGMAETRQRRALGLCERALAAEGPIVRDVLVERLQRGGIRLDVHTRNHIFALLVSTGIACQGPDAGGKSTFVLARDWLGPRPTHDREAALAELARRYLRAFGPATEADFAGWSGLGLRDIRSALASVDRELVEVRVGKGRAWMLRGTARRARRPLVRLLPAYDTYLMGYRDRRFFAKPADWARVAPGGGILRATVLVDGTGIGTWGMRRERGIIRVRVEPFGTLDRPTIEAIEAEVADIGRFERMPAELAAIG